MIEIPVYTHHDEPPTNNGTVLTHYGGRNIYWLEEKLFQFNLYYGDKPILYSTKKFESYRRGNTLGSQTFMYLYDIDGNLHEKVLREEGRHNESHCPELNDPLVLGSIERFIRNYKINEILDEKV
jgi:hypothetical protein